MKTKITLGLLAFSLILLFGTNSCQKETEFSEPSLRLAEEEAIVEGYYTEALSEAEDVSNVMQQNNYQNHQNGPGSGTGPGGGPEVSGERIITVEQVEGESDYPGFPKLITIEFIEWQVGQGRVKDGIIYIWTDGPMRAIGTTRIITFEDFTVDGNLIEGTKTISNLDGVNLTITLEGGKITFTDGSFITREMERNREWIAGLETPFFVWDDEFLFTGSCYGLNRDGVEYTNTITNALHKKMSCRWIVAGTIEMQVGETLTVLDYGDGECDNLATITVDGETTEITLPQQPRPRPIP
ncbi:MAG: hypothetical protein V2I46_06175 [Bacteroides sp.]|nr:hypothetical protein [Bacteroides sp.]